MKIEHPKKIGEAKTQLNQTSEYVPSSALLAFSIVAVVFVVNTHTQCKSHPTNQANNSRKSIASYLRAGRTREKKKHNNRPCVTCMVVADSYFICVHCLVHWSEIIS